MPYKSNRLTSRIAIVGVGDVGAATAYALILGSTAGELLLVDVKENLRDGQVLDLSDAAHRGNTSTHVRAGTYQEAGQCDIVVVTAGAKQKKGTPSPLFPALVTSSANDFDPTNANSNTRRKPNRSSRP